MSDLDPAELAMYVDTIACDIRQRLASEAVDMWELYAEIGEDDWERVVARVQALAPMVHPGELEIALGRLSERGTDGAA